MRSFWMIVLTTLAVTALDGGRIGTASADNTQPFSFVAFGDFYGKPEDRAAQVLESEIAPQIRERSEIKFAIDVGDIGRVEDGSACTDVALEKRKWLWWAVMKAATHPARMRMITHHPLYERIPFARHSWF